MGFEGLTHCSTAAAEPTRNRSGAQSVKSHLLDQGFVNSGRKRPVYILMGKMSFGLRLHSQISV